MYWLESKWVGNEEKLVIYTRGKREIVDLPFRPYCFVKGKGKYSDARSGVSLRKKSFDTVDKMKSAQYAMETFEGDLSYENRVMIDLDWRIQNVPKCWLDIEVDTSDGIPDSKKHEITAIGMIFDDGREVFLTTIGNEGYTEKKMLNDCLSLLDDVGCLMTYNGGSDVWEVRSFDLPYMAMRYGLLNGKDVSTARFKLDYRLRHCVFLDLYQIYKKETMKAGKALAGGFSLDNVCKTEFGEGKVVREKAFHNMSYDEMKEYNMRDVELLKKLDEKYSFSDAQIGLAQMINARLTSWERNKKRQTLNPTSVADNLIIKHSRKSDIVWNNSKSGNPDSIVKGAMVLEPQIGRYMGVQNFDVIQMYPNIIIYEEVSPDIERKVFPEIIEELKVFREKLKVEYKKTEKTEDWIRQYNAKVLANMLYGLFNNPYNRFWDVELAEKITSKGREILGKVVNVCEDSGHKALYGDTDSSFIKIDKKDVDIMAKKINQSIHPYEVEAGEHYDSILFIGNSSGGVKKRYAGLYDGKLKIVGLEAIRKDYCSLARTTQKDALFNVLKGEKASHIKQHIETIYLEMQTGKYDEALVISKGVKKIEEYDTKRKPLPHVRALKKYIASGREQGFDIEFVYTKGDNVEPIIDGKIPKDIDYYRYYKRQLLAVVKPLLDSIQIQTRNENTLMSWCSS